MVNKNEKTDIKSTNYFAPVVAVLGHVDHGKTSLLDSIRKTNVAQEEHGGITQRIGASSIELVSEGKKRKITFIDTPGHEAFAKMRGRGIQAADIGLLVVSLVDGVMPQTKESIGLLLASKIPFIVVLTKTDLPDKNPEKVKQQLLKEGIRLEGYGGDTPVIEVSAKTNTNIKELLELILLVFDMQKNYAFSEKNPLQAIVIESKLDQRSGAKATVVIKDGTLKLRDKIIAGKVWGVVKALINAQGEYLDKAIVGDAVEILGFEKVPPVGSIVVKKIAVADVTRSPANKISTSKGGLSTPTPFSFPLAEEKPPLGIVLCADSEGALEAIVNALPKEVKVYAQKTGDITMGDILLAKSNEAIVLGFNLKIKPQIVKFATSEKVLVKNYNIIYELLDEVRDVLEGRLAKVLEEVFGGAKVLASFPFEKTKVLGIKVMEGRVAKGDKVRLLRNNEVVGESVITSVRQGKNSVSKVEKNEEAGVLLSPFLDFTIGDMLICHS